MLISIQTVQYGSGLAKQIYENLEYLQNEASNSDVTSEN